MIHPTTKDNRIQFCGFTSGIGANKSLPLPLAQTSSTVLLVCLKPHASAGTTASTPLSSRCFQVSISSKPALSLRITTSTVLKKTWTLSWRFSCNCLFLPCLRRTSSRMITTDPGKESSPGGAAGSKDSQAALLLLSYNPWSKRVAPRKNQPSQLQPPLLTASPAHLLSRGASPGALHTSGDARHPAFPLLV